MESNETRHQSRQTRYDGAGLEFLPDDSEAARLVRQIDWSATPLGHPSRWSASLRMVVGFLLANRFPLLLWWGPEHIQIYNDACSPILGIKHLHQAMGKPLRECWHEVYDVLGPLVDTPFNGGPATWMDDIELIVGRRGFPEESHFTIAFSPVPDETAPRGIGGVLATVHEITEKVIGERRAKILSELGTRVAEAKTDEQACLQAIQILSQHPKDVPFALLYLVDDAKRELRLVSTTGVAAEVAGPTILDLDTPMRNVPWPLTEALRTETMQMREGLSSRLGSVAPGPWPDAPDTVAVVPIKSNVAHQPAGALVMGISACIRPDHLYTSFLDLVGSQIATSVANARAYEKERNRTEALAEINCAKTLTEASPAMPDLRSSGTTGTRVVLADDDADMRDHLRNLLSPMYEVEAVADGAQALAAIRRQRPDLVLSDVTMPRLGGFDLLKALRADEQLRDVPCILLCARAGEESRKEVLDAGADDYIVQPFSARELHARVAASLKTARLRQEFSRRIAADLNAMTRLHEIGNLCVRPGDALRECLDAILDAAIAFTEAEKGNIQLLEKPSGFLKIAVHRGFERPFLDFFAEVNYGEAAVCGMAMQAVQRVVVEDITRSEIFAGQPALDVLLAAGVRAVQSTPLVSSTGAVMGMISTHFSKPHQPGERELRLLDLLVRQASDYLERKAADRAFRLRTAQFETLLNEAPLGVYVVDTDFQIRAINPTARQVFGNIPRLVGRDFNEVIHILWPEAYADEIVQRFRHTLRTGEPYFAPERIEKRLDRNVTEYYEWQINRIALPDGGYGVVCYFRDISQQFEARRMLEQQAAELETANRTKDEFLAMLGHELRNPLSPIVTALQVMRLRGAQSREQGIIERQVGHLGRLVDDLLDVSRITKGLIQLRKEPVEMAEVVVRAIEMAKPLLEQRQHRLEVDVPRQGVGVLGDLARLGQVVSNLLTNAGKYSEAGSHILVRAWRESDKVHVSVKDEGVGIAPEMAEQIFELFMQESQSADRSRGGLGLGLAIVRNIVQMHGGSVRAHSEGRGRGSEFLVTLPALDLHEVSSPARTAEPAPAAQPTGKRVLVVDDNSDAAEMLQLILEQVGYTVMVAEDGPSALKTADIFLPDIALVDIGLPVMDGYEVAQHLRERQKGGHMLRLVAITGYGMPADQRRSLAAGFETHLVKPVDLQTLLRVIN